MAVGVCGLLAVLINIRNLLAASVDQRRLLDEPRDKSEDSRTCVSGWSFVIWF